MPRRDTTETAEITFALSSHRLSSAVANPANAQQAGTRLRPVTIAMALAIHFQDLIDRGVARDFADVARLAGISRERVSQLSKLLWLAPDIQADLLTGSRKVSESSARRSGCEPAWIDQRSRLNR